MLTESRDLAAELGDIELQAEAMEWRIAALIALGDLEAARAELAVVYEMASRVGQPFIIHVAEHYRSAIALCDGRLAEAEATAERSFEWGRLLTGRDPSGSYGVQMFGIRREQGRLAELAPVVRILAGGEQRRRVWGPGVAAMLAELGMADEARRELDRVRRRGLAELRAGPVARVADLPGRRLLAHRRRRTWPPTSTPSSRPTPAASSRSATAWPATARPTGTWASSPRSAGERELACAHLETALAVDRGMGAWTWLAHTQYHLGRLLLADRRRRSRPWPRADAGGRRARGADRHARAARPHPGAGRAPGSAAAAGRALAARAADPAPRRPGHVQPRDRHASSSSASTPRRTTSAASCARPDAPIAPRPPSYAYQRGLTRSPAAE